MTASLTLLVPLAIHAQSKSSLRPVDSTLAAYVARGQLAGGVVLVARGGEVVHHVAYGERSLGSREAMRLDQRFRIASMTKPVTTVAALMLAERGGLSIDDDVAKYIPEFGGVRVHAGASRARPPSRAITIRDLLTHTSGIGGLGGEPMDSIYAKPGALDRSSLAGFVASLARLPLLADPGDRWIYSYSTDVLGRVVEVVSGKSLDDFLRTEIFEPLEMWHTGYWLDRGSMSDLAVVHEWDGARLRPASGPIRDLTTRPAFVGGNGGLISTAGDYFRFAEMLRNGGAAGGRRFLADSTVRMMTRPQPSIRVGEWGPVGMKRKGEGFGLGVAVLVDREAAGYASGNGSWYWPGSLNTFFWVDPVQGVVGILLTQYQPFRAFPLERDVMAAAYRGLASGAVVR